MELTETGTLSVDVGSRLRQLRQERDMSMRALARSSGLSTNALSMIERGRTSPSVSTLYKISDALGVDYGFLPAGTSQTGDRLSQG